MKQLNKEEKLKKQNSFKNILTFISMAFLLLAYVTYLNVNYVELPKKMGLIVVISILPLIIEVISSYLNAKGKKDEEVTKRYKIYLNMFLPIVSFIVAKYFYYYTFNENMDIKLNAVIAILSSVGIVIYTKSILGFAILQIFNIFILAEYNLGEAVVFPLFAIGFIIFSLMYVINVITVDLEKDDAKTKKKKNEKKPKENLELKLDNFKKDCIRWLVSISIMLIVYGIFKIIPVLNNGLTNMTTILLTLGIINADFIKNRFKFFPKIYGFIYELALLYFLVFEIGIKGIIDIDYAMYTNLVLIVLNGYLLLGKSNKANENIEIFIIQLVLFSLPIITGITKYSGIVVLSILDVYLLIRAFVKNKDERYIPYIMPLILFLYIKMHVLNNITNAEVIYYMIVSVVFYLPYRKLKKLTNSK